MRFLFILLSVLTLSCKERADTHPDRITFANKDTVSSTSTSRQSDTVTWADNLRAFRDAVYHGDKEKSKQYINLPILNPGNEIWYLVYQQDEERISQLPEKVKPFTEVDYSKYFNKLFPASFINTLLKIRSEDLFDRGNAETPAIKEGYTTYRMYATFNKDEKTLTLNLASETEMKDDNGEAMDDIESNVIYQFDVIGDKEIKLKQVRLAG